MKNNSLLVDLLRVFTQGKSTRRFLVGSILSFAFSITVILCTIGLMDGFEHILRRSLKKSSGDISVINTRGFFTYDSQAQAVFNDQKISVFTGLIQTEGFAIFDEKSKGVLIKGVDPTSFNEVTGLSLSLFQGEVAIGKALAQELKIKVGDDIVLAMGQGNLSYSSLPILIRFKVAQIVDHKIYEKDLRFIYVNREQLSSVLSHGPKINSIMLNSPQLDIAKFAKKLNALLPMEYEVKPYWNDFKVLLEAVAVEKYSIGLVLQLIVVVSIFNILAFVIYLNEKRTQEIFLLRALGVSAKGLSRLWFGMVIFIWGMACATSVVFTEIFNQMLKHLDILHLPGEIYVLSDLELTLSFPSYLMVFSLALAWLLIIAGFTVLRGKRKGIVTELKKGFV
ncbi:MAG: FtsX-like permease family protein [Bacteriovoracaceae bacterium]